MKKIILSIAWLFIIIGFWFFSNWAIAQQLESAINVNGSCLTWMWQWCFSYDKMMRSGSSVERKNEEKTVMVIAQDVMLSATYMVWTVLTLVIIYCGLMYIFASKDGGDVSKYKKWLIYAAIGAILVRWAYAIVRLIQYVAKW